MGFRIKYTLERDNWGVTTELTPVKGTWVPSIVMTGIEDEGDTKAKDEESGYIWCESPEFKTHSESDILELWGNWSMKKKRHSLWL